MTILIISNEEMEGIIKIVKSIKESGLFIKSVSEKNENKAREQNDDSFPMSISALGANLLEDILAGKGVIRTGEGTIRADQKILYCVTL